jgi:hypothetical protein
MAENSSKIQTVSQVELRDIIFNFNFDRLCKKAHEFINEKGYLATDTCLLVIHVDDPGFQDLVEIFAPDQDAMWSKMRSSGDLPLLITLARWKVTEAIRIKVPKLEKAINRGPNSGFLYAFICAGGGISIYQVPYDQRGAA